ncbi:MAG: sugar ABC transporter ATP-binding protein [Anaerolineales bacterium]|nr:MAG: sugar ABC transporter ATP-binding protein [Anaerolineales bacterium]
MANPDFLQMRAISKSYDGTQALREVDFSATIGEVHAIVGENGAGKTTLIKILAGALRPDAGRILLAGQPVDLSTPHDAFNLGIRTVYQEFSLIPHLTVTENILLGQMPRGRLSWWVDWARAHRRADEILQGIGFTGIHVRTPISRMSVSLQQMVEIAKAVAERPTILILDEPSAVLSQEELRLLFALIRKLKQESTLILYISHRLDEVFEVADRITVLRDGEVVGTVDSQATNESDLIGMMVGRTLDQIYPTRDMPPGEEILAVKNLSREGAFTDVSFSLARGEILGLFGLVGSGRTQLARCIFGAELPTSGTIYLDGEVIRPRSPHYAVLAGIALLTEDRKRDGLVLSCSVRDNSSLVTMQRMGRGIFLDRQKQHALVQSKVQELDIRPAKIERLVRTLSGGNQQKVVLAKWLLAEAKVLILDEPTRGVDVATKVEIYHIIGDLADKGVGILLISSELPEILGMSDRALVFREGRLVGEFSRSLASEESLLASAAGVVH